MEVVSTSNLVSSETEKITTGYNFQHDYVMRGQQIGSYAYMQTWSYSWNLFHDVKKHPKKHIHIKQQNQKQPAISQKKNFVLFWKNIIHQGKHIVHLTIRYHLFLEFWLVNTVFFCWMTSTPCCNLPRNCTPVKYKKKRRTFVI